MAKPIQPIRYPATRKAPIQQEEIRVFQLLVDSGFIDEAPEEGNLPLPDFTPLPVEGKPAAEIIIEDRGER